MLLAAQNARRHCKVSFAMLVLIQPACFQKYPTLFGSAMLLTSSIATITKPRNTSSERSRVGRVPCVLRTVAVRAMRSAMEGSYAMEPNKDYRPERRASLAAARRRGWCDNILRGDRDARGVSAGFDTGKHRGGGAPGDQFGVERAEDGFFGLLLNLAGEDVKSLV